MKSLAQFLTILAITFSILLPRVVESADKPNLRIGSATLTLIPISKCKRDPKGNAESLSRYLDQYSYEKEWGLTYHHRGEDEEDQSWRSFSPDLQKLLSSGLTERGFRLPGGGWAMITWMDFDGDGVCDFTSSVGDSGMRRIQRIFLYQGESDGRYKLVFADYLVEDTVSIIPFIPVGISDEKLPAILLGADGWNLLQWYPAEQAFRACRPPEYETFSQPAYVLLPVSKRTLPAEKFKQICEKVRDIGKWAESQLPRQNVAPRYSEEDSRETCTQNAIEIAKQGTPTFNKAYQECKVRPQ